MHSFRNIKAIIPGLFIYTVRNVIPMYDMEGRKALMKRSNWNLLIMFQIMVSCFNMLLLNNIMDKCFIILGSLLTVFIYFGIVKSFFTAEEMADGGAGYIGSFSSSTVVVILFMYMQKRIHKEVFMEIKQRVSQ